METNDRIREVRKRLHLTQQEFADKIGVKRNTVSQYEIGRNDPIDSVFCLICREFNVNETWLRTGEGKMFLDNQLPGCASFLDPDFLNTLSQLSTEDLAHLKGYAAGMLYAKKKADGQSVSLETL